MKPIKILLASFAFFALFTVFASNAPTHTRTPICVDKELVWDGGNQSGADFVIASGTKAWLNDAVNWGSSFQAYGNFMCFGSGKLCKVRIRYCYDTRAGETDPNPTIQNVVDVVQNAYNDAASPHSFTTPIAFTVGSNPIVISVTVFEKS